MNNEVFVTYSQGEENSKVYSLVATLRENGFHAVCDLMEMQKETAMDFNEMMQRGLSSKKVIVVLSEDYKRKAEKFSNGVGSEYRSILNDININKNKYIFVCFKECTTECLKSIMPVMFGNREVISLASKEGLNKLYAKLQDKKLYEFPDVKEDKPHIVTKKIKPLFDEADYSSKIKYIVEAKELMKSVGIRIGNSGYTESKGTQLYSGISELEDGRVVIFACENFDIIDNNVWYYYNVKNKVLYKYTDNTFLKIV